MSVSKILSGFLIYFIFSLNSFAWNYKGDFPTSACSGWLCCFGYVNESCFLSLTIPNSIRASYEGGEGSGNVIVSISPGLLGFHSVNIDGANANAHNNDGNPYHNNLTAPLIANEPVNPSLVYALFDSSNHTLTVNESVATGIINGFISRLRCVDESREVNISSDMITRILVGIATWFDISDLSNIPYVTSVDVGDNHLLTLNFNTEENESFQLEFYANEHATHVPTRLVYNDHAYRISLQGREQASRNETDAHNNDDDDDDRDRDRSEKKFGGFGSKNHLLRNAALQQSHGGTITVLGKTSDGSKDLTDGEVDISSQQNTILAGVVILSALLPECFPFLKSPSLK